MGSVYINEKGVTIRDSVYVGGDIGSSVVSVTLTKSDIKEIYRHFILDEPFPKPEPPPVPKDFAEWVLGDKDD